MKWHLLGDKAPELGVDVLVCFEPGNPFSCDVCSLEMGDRSYIWYRTDKNYEADPTDYWAVIPMPEPKIPAYHEEEE